MTWLLIIACLVVIGLTGVPIGIGLALTGMLILYLNGGEFLAIPAVWNVFTSFIFSAVPAFIFMGEVLLRSGVTRRLYDAANPFFKKVLDSQSDFAKMVFPYRSRILTLYDSMVKTANEQRQ